MKKIGFGFALTFIFLNIGFSQQNLYNELSYDDEYRLLITDLMNCNTIGYKSFFNDVMNKADVKRT